MMTMTTTTGMTISNTIANIGRPASPSSATVVAFTLVVNGICPIEDNFALEAAAVVVNISAIMVVGAEVVVDVIDSVVVVIVDKVVELDEVVSDRCNFK